MTSYIPGWFIPAVILVLTGCDSKKVKGPDEQRFVISDSLLHKIRIDTVVKCQLVNTLTFSGKVSYNEEKVARIYPLVTGNISDIKVQLGDYVNKGKELGVIRSIEMASYDNDLVTAKTNLLNAQKNFEAMQQMYKGDLITERDLITAKVAYEQAEAQVTKATNVLQINGGNTKSEYVIKAPVNGFIVEKQVTNNMSIRSDNANSLFTISDLKNVWVWANVYESNINQVHLNDPVQVVTLSYPGQVFSGKIDKIVNVLDPVNKVMKVRIVLPNPQFKLKPDMFASVTVTNDQEHTKSLCIPLESLIFDHSEYFILLYKSQADVRIVPVQVLSQYRNSAFIKGDVQEGDKIIGSYTLLIYQSLNG